MNPKTQETKTWKEVVEKFDRAEHALEERDRSNGLVYSLDDENIRDFLENQCVDCHKNPHRVFVKKEAYRILYEALKALSDSQRCRMHLRFWEQKSYSEIARLEGVDESAVRRSIERGLRQLKKKLTGTGVTANDFAERSPTRYVKHFHPKKENTDRQKAEASIIKFDDGGVADGE